MHPRFARRIDAIGTGGNVLAHGGCDGLACLAESCRIVATERDPARRRKAQKQTCLLGRKGHLESIACGIARVEECYSSTGAICTKDQSTTHIQP
jgi:hypothetical protein